MSEELNKLDKLIKEEQQRANLHLMVRRAVAKPMRPHMRPHTWVFLRQKDNPKDPVICLGIVFHTWDRAKYNMVRFTAHDTNSTREITTSGRLTVLDNGEIGIIIDKRWPWTTLLKEFRGLSAGDL